MKRRKAREYVLQFLYGIDLLAEVSEGGEARDERRREDLGIFWAEAKEDDENVRRFAEDVIRGTIEHLEEIDELIRGTAEHWRIGRMAAVDRNILRFAAYELLYRPDIPEAVTINEALEIAKKFSTVESASFINGILDRIARDRRITGEKEDEPGHKSG